VLLSGLALRPRLTLRLSLLSRPFRGGLRLGDRGEMVRRGLDKDLDRCRPSEASEYGDLVRGRPRSGDRGGILRLHSTCSCVALEDARYQQGFYEEAPR
jgi:hypothetical protein